MNRIDSAIGHALEKAGGFAPSASVPTQDSPSEASVKSYEFPVCNMLPSEPPNDTAQTEEVVRPASSVPTNEILRSELQPITSADHERPASRGEGQQSRREFFEGSVTVGVATGSGSAETENSPVISLLKEGVKLMPLGTAKRAAWINRAMDAITNDSLPQMLSALEAVELWFYESGVYSGDRERALLERVQKAIKAGRS